MDFLAKLDRSILNLKFSNWNALRSLVLKKRGLRVPYTFVDFISCSRPRDFILLISGCPVMFCKIHPVVPLLNFIFNWAFRRNKPLFFLLLFSCLARANWAGYQSGIKWVEVIVITSLRLGGHSLWRQSKIIQGPAQFANFAS